MQQSSGNAMATAIALQLAQRIAIIVCQQITGSKYFKEYAFRTLHQHFLFHHLIFLKFEIRFSDFQVSIYGTLSGNQTIIQ
ncbi:hypothetical protein T10_8322 [Trichinella papuae]|uniref:Uncharacterized protein n=1 Tax=Trichinella papuae TaxID=268474 RepID=A0A0V1N6R6_9BILA|nr:hypothetical protein T10_8322 [Trichinella papuae]